jgi:NADP-dependent 3-hydroxy acid dehydrogenase YdfG
MKIAITGHSAGIGQALASIYQSQGHEIIGLSRRNGYNIRSIPKVTDMIVPCDMFINNAQAGFAQTELLFEVAKHWQDTNKKIIVISTQMTQSPVSPLPGLDMDLYRIQKVALEESVKQIRRHKTSPNIMLVRPGDIATSLNKTVPPSADVNNWAQTLVDIINLSSPTLEIPDISLVPSRI